MEIACSQGGRRHGLGPKAKSAVDSQPLASGKESRDHTRPIQKTEVVFLVLETNSPGFDVLDFASKE